MARNPYFKDYSGEQNVTEDITIETIKTMGRDVVYMPRDSVSTDSLFGEDLSKKFDDGYEIEMYISNVDGFEGEGDVISQYGLQIKDRAEFIVSRRRFDEEVGMVESLTRPREGDLIYFPLSKTLFEINFVEHENPFYQLGKLYTYKLSCEVFTLDASDEITTGNTDIDSTITDRTSVSDDLITIRDPDSTESGDNSISDFDNNIFDFTESDPFSEGNF
jgi:hypothetical protein|tara:strand:+ start:7616 stop:8272 length:657 start_codon:yes stop_codon:yes gene_type:complete